MDKNKTFQKKEISIHEEYVIMKKKWSSLPENTQNEITKKIEKLNELANFVIGNKMFEEALILRDSKRRLINLKNK